MSELIGITGAIGSGKTTFMALLGNVVEDHAIYEASEPIVEVANRFNQLLEAELNYNSTDNDVELVNQIAIWMPDVIAEHTHYETTWNHIALNPKDMRAHPELYEKLLVYLKRVHSNLALAEQTITVQNKSDYRDLLQWIGGYLVAKTSPTLWFDEILRRIDVYDAQRSLVIIGGVRYKHDAACIKNRGGRIVRIVRSQDNVDSTDITELQQSSLVADIVIKNNGSVQQLQELAETVWNDIAGGKPRAIYSAK